MENNNTGTGGAYTVPSLDDINTPAEADSALNTLHAAWRVDSRHPYGDANHPQHAEWQGYVNGLYKAKFAEADPRPPLEQTMGKALEAQAQDQEQRATQAEQIVDQMTELGFEGIPVYDDLLPHELKCMEVGLQCAKGQWQESIQEIQQLLEQYVVGPEGWAMFHELRAMPDNRGNRKVAMAARVLQHVWNRGRQRIGLGPRKSQEEGEQE